MEKNKINLLFVDDEDQFLTSMGKRLEARGFNVMAVNRGERAVEAARAHPVDIALVDHKIPGMSGDEILKVLKQEHPWMEVVILIHHGGIDSVVKCLRCGAYSYLQKPCDLEQIVEVIEEAYKKREKNRRRIEETQMKALMQNVKFGSPMIMSQSHINSMI
jgi:DNA-binding NtrC family response regulator